MKGRLIDLLRLVAGLAASIGLGWLAVHGLDWGLVAEQLRGVSILTMLLSLGIFILASLLRAYRWQLLFVKEKLPVLRLFVVQNEGIGLNNLVPIRVASEATQLAVLTIRDRVNAATALATLGMERVIDVVASTMLLGIAFFLVPEMKHFTLYVWGAIGFTVVAVALVRFLSWGSEALAFIKRFRFLAEFATAVKDLERQRGRLAASLLVSFCYWILIGVCTWTIAVAMDLSISLMTATLVIMGTIFFATAVPAAPSALGTFEFAVVYVLSYFGIEREAGFGFAVLTHAVLFLPPTVIAVLFLPREGLMSLMSAEQVRRLAARVGGAGHTPAH